MELRVSSSHPTRVRSAHDRDHRAAQVRAHVAHLEVPDAAPTQNRNVLEVMNVRQNRTSWTTDELPQSPNSSPTNRHYEVVSVSVWSSPLKTSITWPNDEPMVPAILKVCPGKMSWDFGRTGSVATAVQLFDDPTYGHPYYSSTLSSIPHEHFISVATPDGPAVISIEKGTTKLRAIFWSRAGAARFVIPQQHGKMDAVAAFFPQLQKVNWTLVDGPVMRKVLEEHEMRDISHDYKFGVLYCRAGQKTENEFYANHTLSPAFEEFLNLIGRRVELAKHTGFRGGLQTNGSTGSHSVYTVFKDLEIMFHVAPLLPRKDADLQQLEKKRHLGNDVCLIVFRDADCTEPFSPEIISSQFNHVFIVVQPQPCPAEVPEGYRTTYHVSVCGKLGVGGFGPPLPVNGEGPHGHHFRDWLLAKLVNGERAAMNAPDFRGKLNTTRFRYLSPLVGKYAASKQMQAIMSI